MVSSAEGESEVTDTERLDELEREFDSSDEIVARKWGDGGRSIDGDLEWLIGLGRKSDRYEKALREILAFHPFDISEDEHFNYFVADAAGMRRIAREALKPHARETSSVNPTDRNPVKEDRR